MVKSRVTMVAISAVVVVGILLGIFFFRWQSEGHSPAQPVPETSTAVNLGITYLPVIPRLAAYYDLGVDSGVLVTEVISGSPAQRAGVQEGDVILSFNGVIVGEGTPLLGMMRACPAGNRVVLEVWRGKNSRIIEFAHTGK